MSERPAPLTPSEADLRDFPFMPIMVQRLKRSRAWLLCKRRPELAFYLVNLWTEAWHSKPAGPLENDDLVLADAAMCSEATFAELRPDIMRGWVECHDGRLYHPVVAEQVLIAWERKLAQRSRTEAARAARDAKRKGASSVTEDVTDVVTDSKGQGQGQGHLDRSSSPGSDDRARTSAVRSLPKFPGARRTKVGPPARKHPFPVDAFDRWYVAYPRKKARQDAERAFRKIEAVDATPFAVLVAGIDAFRRENPDVAFWPYPATWLNGRRWEDETTGVAASAGDDGEPRIDFGGGVCWRETIVRATVDRWRRDATTWPADRLGPPPGHDGCRVPEHLLRMAA